MSPSFPDNRNDFVAMLVLLSLLMSGVLTGTEVYAEGSDPAVLAVSSMFIISKAIVFTGIAAKLGDFILRYDGMSELRIMIIIMLVTCGTFMSSTATVAIFIPITIIVAAKVLVTRALLVTTAKKLQRETPGLGLFIRNSRSFIL